MPVCRNYDPEGLRRRFESANERYNTLDWEVEDLLSETLKQGFLEEYPTSMRRWTSADDKIHRDWTDDGKARLHHFARLHAVHSDLTSIVDVLLALWAYLGMDPS
jgi:hypothetical protein